MTRKEMMQAALDSGKYQNRAQVRTAYQNAKYAAKNNNPEWKTGFARTTARDWVAGTPEPTKVTIAPSAVTLATHPELFKPVNVPEVEINPVDTVEWTDADTTALDNTIAELGLPEVPRLSNEDIAKQVIAGKWGNGADRVKRLTEAGYDPNAIRSIVNGSMPKKVASTSIKKVGDNSSLDVASGNAQNTTYPLYGGDMMYNPNDILINYSSAEDLKKVQNQKTLLDNIYNQKNLFLKRYGSNANYRNDPAFKLLISKYEKNYGPLEFKNGGKFKRIK